MYQSIKVMERYSTNLTDKQWQVIEKIVNPQEKKRKHSLRNIMNAILYLLKTGCQWRMIPKDFAPWESVYYYFSKWKNEGVIEEILRTGFLTSSDGNLKSCSDLMNVRPNSRSSQNDGSLKDLSHGWKTSEDGL